MSTLLPMVSEPKAVASFPFAVLLHPLHWLNATFLSSVCGQQNVFRWLDRFLSLFRPAPYTAIVSFQYRKKKYFLVIHTLCAYLIRPGYS